MPDGNKHGHMLDRTTHLLIPAWNVYATYEKLVLAVVQVQYTEMEHLTDFWVK